MQSNKLSRYNICIGNNQIHFKYWPQVWIYCIAGSNDSLRFIIIRMFADTMFVGQDQSSKQSKVSECLVEIFFCEIRKL